MDPASTNPNSGAQPSAESVQKSIMEFQVTNGLRLTSHTESQSTLRLFAKKLWQRIAAAFKVWENATNLKFEAVNRGHYTIDIRFDRGEHSDGPSSTLGHEHPIDAWGSVIQFDDNENWTIDSNEGTNLFQVAVHEIGHSLGLSHSDVQSAVMFEHYQGYQKNFKLDHDDELAIQALYGKKSQQDQLNNLVHCGLQ
ncbi:50 kDa hatching enzyme-like [Macrobrachium nipponense]|uniref:50 kDa hatching enzyme-like n=1 Tax=Macrobrachium nipponense TaxID=159736 RepID=UPI0030C8AB04